MGCYYDARSMEICQVSFSVFPLLYFRNELCPLTFMFPDQLFLKPVFGHCTPHSRLFRLFQTGGSTSSGNEVPGMISLQHEPAYLTAYWEWSLSKHSPPAAKYLAQLRWHCWRHFWNSCFVPLRQTLLLERVRSHSKPNQRDRVGAPFQ